ncbi:MAG TPA: asparagine synthase (glutamine-hydrolyzing), partial [Bacteroidia bacterium]|nr:asparagine synthase (glutamine-hydrolyzing) [Bacteroidia bacterium]
FKTLRLELQRALANDASARPYPFKTQSDTEVILAAYIRWGADCLKYFNGMFAFAIWDKEKQELFIARDRLGIKPLYYWHDNKIFAFASEIRALLEGNFISRKIDVASLNDYVTYQTVHAPHTIIENVKMLMPGHYILLKKGGLQNGIKQNKYWSLLDIPVQKPEKSYSDICTDVQQLLFNAVEMRLVADVPFGAFLSGGIDSSIVVAIMSKVMNRKVQTFSVSFDESAFNEAPFAEQIAKHYNTEHHDIKISPKTCLEKLPKALSSMDHPSGDGINSYIVSEATKHAGVTMALSGLGGDELFAGYPLFKRLYKLEKIKWIKGFPNFLLSFPASIYNILSPSPASAKLVELCNLPNWNLDQTYHLTRETLSKKEVSNLLSYQTSIERSAEFNSEHGILSRISTAELSNYLPDILLRDTDQMSMAHALEVRVPFLDYKLVEYVIGLSDNVKYPTTPKKLLTDATKGLLPDNIINRKKMGFTFPWREWMKTDLMAFCESNMHSLAKRDSFNGGKILDLWNNFQQNSNKTPWYKIWHLVVLENWMQENNIDG